MLYERIPINVVAGILPLTEFPRDTQRGRGGGVHTAMNKFIALHFFVYWFSKMLNKHEVFYFVVSATFFANSNTVDLKAFVWHFFE